MVNPLGTPDAIGGPSSEEEDVPVAGGGNVDELIAAPDMQNNAYKQGGKVSCATSKISTHIKNKSSPGW